MGNEQKAIALVQEAEKKLSSSKSFLGGLFGGANKQDEALECYGRAANLFKMAKKWSQAGQTFVTVATHHAKLGNKHDSATNYVDAANCYKKSDPKEAVNCLSKAIDIYTDMGRFTIAAKHHQTIAELYESDIADFERAMQHYEKSADYFRGEESNSSANKCMLKVALHAAQLENYERAIQIYEQVAASALESSLIKYSAKEHFPAFGDSREAKLVKALIKHLEDEDVEAFTAEVKNFDQISRLDQWYTTILLRIKKQMPDDNELC